MIELVDMQGFTIEKEIQVEKECVMGLLGHTPKVVKMQSPDGTYYYFKYIETANSRQNSKIKIINTNLGPLAVHSLTLHEYFAYAFAEMLAVDTCNYGLGLSTQIGTIGLLTEEMYPDARYLESLYDFIPGEMNSPEFLEALSNRLEALDKTELSKMVKIHFIDVILGINDRHSRNIMFKDASFTSLYPAFDFDTFGITDKKKIMAFSIEEALAFNVAFNYNLNIMYCLACLAYTEDGGTLNKKALQDLKLPYLAKKELLCLVTQCSITDIPNTYTDFLLNRIYEINNFLEKISGMSVDEFQTILLEIYSNRDFMSDDSLEEAITFE